MKAIYLTSQKFYYNTPHLYGIQQSNNLVFLEYTELGSKLKGPLPSQNNCL